MYHGSLVAMVTPMRADDSLDDAALARLVEFHVEAGTDGIVAVGTTGESATLDPEEHCQVVARVVELVDGRVPVIAGTGANATKEALHLTHAAKDAGADACLLVTPYYNKPTQHGLYEHFRTIAEAVDIPQILYNVPGRTACDMQPETVARLADVERIVGIKEAPGDASRFAELIEACPADFAVLSGEDGLTLEGMRMGLKGVISVTANIAPRAMHDMIAAALAGDFDEAARIDGRLRPLHRALFLESNPIPAKWALADMGLIGAGIRLPLTPLSPGLHEEVREAVQIAEAVPA